METGNFKTPNINIETPILNNPLDSISISSASDYGKVKNIEINGKIQKFKDLSIGWKTMVIIGAISLIVVVGLIILLILIFETDIIPIETLLGAKEDLDLSEYDKFFESMDEELEAELDLDEDSDSDLDSIFNDSDSSSTITKRADLIRKIDEISITLDKITEMKNSNLEDNIIDWSLMKIDLVH